MLNKKTVVFNHTLTHIVLQDIEKKYLLKIQILSRQKICRNKTNKKIYNRKVVDFFCDLKRKKMVNKIFFKVP